MVTWQCQPKKILDYQQNFEKNVIENIYESFLWKFQIKSFKIKEAEIFQNVLKLTLTVNICQESKLSFNLLRVEWGSARVLSNSYKIKTKKLGVINETLLMQWMLLGIVWQCFTWLDHDFACLTTFRLANFALLSYETKCLHTQWKHSDYSWSVPVPYSCKSHIHIRKTFPAVVFFYFFIFI